jgi:hypothetical protein
MLKRVWSYFCIILVVLISFLTFQKLEQKLSLCYITVCDVSVFYYIMSHTENDFILSNISCYIFSPSVIFSHYL